MVLLESISCYEHKLSLILTMDALQGNTWP
uniref:Uncharacterized protein n=1 Tax=Arundo donax TaxID=35708 RepID=A0A0A9EWP1_ARUDO